VFAGFFVGGGLGAGGGGPFWVASRDMLGLRLATGISMRSNQELYNFVEDLIHDLMSIDLSAEAERLRLAMDTGSTGTEVFLALRYELTVIQSTGAQLSDETMSKISQALAAIDSALR
jgi:hypothetical protein